MALKNWGILLVLSIFGVSTVFAQDVDYLTIDSVKISKIHQDVLKQEISETILEKDMESEALLELPGMPNKMGQISVSDAGAGKIIGIAKELVALGEDI